jgi:DNA polymerase-3 subunit epsilon
MRREIVLDTETTGIDPKSGHRIIELGCVELEDYVPTGRNFHRYVDPCREIDADAERVHGISNAMLVGKPRFNEAEVVERFLEFVGEDSILIAHNADFDRGFVNHELALAGFPPITEERWLDTHVMARNRFPGMHNSLDALCKRFKISLAERDKHGALLDARLLAAVYLELRGGRERVLDFGPAAIAEVVSEVVAAAYGPRPRPLVPRCTDTERERHAAFIAETLKDKAIWLTIEVA